MARPKKKVDAQGRELVEENIYKLPSGRYQVDVRIYEQRLRRTLGTVQEARTELLTLRSAAAAGEAVPEPPKAVRETIGHWLMKFHARTRNKDSQRNALRWHALIGDLLPEEINAEFIEAWAKKRQQPTRNDKGQVRKGVKPATLARELSALQGAFTLAFKAGAVLIQHNPFTDREAFNLPAIDNRNTVHQFSWEEKVALKREFGEFWWPYFKFALITGLRFSQQASLEHSDIDAERGRATIRASSKTAGTKNTDTDWINLTQDALDIIALQRERFPENPLVFPSDLGGRRLKPSDFRKRVWGPAFERAGVKGRWHDGRGTFACDQLQAGFELGIVQQNLLHKDERTTQVYAKYAKRQLLAASQAVAALTP